MSQYVLVTKIKLNRKHNIPQEITEVLVEKSRCGICLLKTRSITTTEIMQFEKAKKE